MPIRHRPRGRSCREAGSGHEDIVINVQGDEPLIDPEVISSACKGNDALSRIESRNTNNDAQTRRRIDKSKRGFRRSKINLAMHFIFPDIPFHFIENLAGIPFFIGPQQHLYYKHIGVYAYRAGVLKQFVELGESPLERAERLEQFDCSKMEFPFAA